ncbi:hypothetical protein AMJ49_01090 [Parcubacteria bacterium DG_74_2]|nr:MAG: hypothetical protein AMJ49_01090 [Parcubacteria bacterium DG_74_2]
MEGSTQYELWVDEGFIRKVSLEELAQATIIKKTKVVWFAEKGGKKILIDFFADSSHTIAQDKTHIVKRAATGVLFTEVEEYRQMIFFDHFRRILLYTDDIFKVKGYENSYLIAVLRYPDDLVELIAEAILKKEAKDLKTKRGASEI